MKNLYLLSALIILYIAASSSAYSQTINGGLPDPSGCTNCSGTTLNYTKVATTLGIGTQATDSAAFASGKGSVASGLYSTALGNLSVASGQNSFAAGYLAKATAADAYALGYKAQAMYQNSIAIGYLVKATSTNSIVIGQGRLSNQLPLVNNISNSIMLGMGATTPTMTILGGDTTKRVGINTMYPQANLDVNGTLRTTNFQLSRSTQANWVLGSDATGNGQWVNPKTLGIWSLNGSHAYYTGGNVGIGTNNPAARLDVAGTLKVQDLKLSGGAEGNIMTRNSAGSAVWTDAALLKQFADNVDGNYTTTKRLGISTTAQTQLYGNLQIGSEFVFSGAANSDNKIIGNNYKWGAAGNMRINDGYTSMISFGDDNGSVSLHTAGTGTANSPVVFKTLVFTAEGKLGVGLNNPQHTIDVQAPGEVSAHFHSQTALRSTIWASNTQRSYGFGVDATGTGHIYRSINRDPLMTFTTDGKVLISTQAGLTTPGSHRLYVDGSIVTTEVKIATISNWSDFVFDENYALPHLNDVEAFIKTNGHLPGVPNADQVKKEGINLAETHALLLQKIEELTLYILQQEKRIQELEKLLPTTESSNK